MKTIELSAALASAPVQENLKNFAGLDAQNALGLMTPERLAAVAGEKIGVVSKSKNGLLSSYDYSRMFPKKINLSSLHAIKLVNNPTQWGSYFAHVYGSYEHDVLNVYISFQLQGDKQSAIARGKGTKYLKFFYDANGVYLYNPNERANNKSVWIEGSEPFVYLDTVDLVNWKEVSVIP